MTISVEPDPDTVQGPFDVEQDAMDWCIAIHVEGRLPNDSDIEIAVIDTCHGGPHFDRYFTHTGKNHQDKKDLSEWSYREARRLLLVNWEEYVTLYGKNHGIS